MDHPLQGVDLTRRVHEDKHLARLRDGVPFEWEKDEAQRGKHACNVLHMTLKDAAVCAKHDARYLGTSVAETVKEVEREVREISARPIPLGYALVAAAGLAFAVDYVRRRRQ